jgi:magnesium chelatase family protein
MPGKKITINMARLRKEGYDLTLTIGILVASEQIKAIDIDKYIIMGELSLDGLQPIRALPIAIKAKEEGFKGFFFQSKMKEAAIVTGLDVYGVENVQEVIDFLEGKGNLEPTTIDTRAEFYRFRFS